MEEIDEEIVILEDALKQNDKDREKDKNKQTKAIPKNKTIIILGVIIVTLILIISLLFIFLADDEKLEEVEEIKIPKKVYKPKTASFKKSNVEKLIEKANLLYLKGAKKESIEVFKEVAAYNESLSYYNLGVVKLNDKQYKYALSLFQKAIDSREEVCISAINAAVASLHLKNKKLFSYYISLANAYLPKERGKPIYHHYSSIINYYLNLYNEAIVPLKHPNSKSYEYTDTYLKSKLYFATGETQHALNSLEKLTYNSQNYLTLGLLSARVGSYEVAKNYLLKAKGNDEEKRKIDLALSLVNMKLGNIPSSTNNLKSLKNKLKDEDIRKIYKIKTILKKSLFSPQKAQESFQKTGLFNKENKFAMLFYFTPYKIFNANKSVDYIRKGGINYVSGEKNSGYFKLAQNLSSGNLKILDGILSAIDYDLIKAKNIFENLLQQNPKNSILHYNLALIFAQLGEYKKAHQLFVKSYHLDKNLYIAGIYALMCGDLSFQTKFLSNLKEEILVDLREETNEKKLKFANALLSIYLSDELVSRKYLETNEQDNGLALVIKTIISSEIGYKSIYTKFASKLLEAFPNDIIANILHIDSKYKNENIKEYAKNIQIHLQNKHLNFNPLYYGYDFVTKIYTEYMMISGLLYKVKQTLLKQLKNETKNITGILKSTAYISLYTKDFKKAFTYYNELIDSYNISDSKTLFYAAMSAIGANESANAIALLEISKIKNKSNFESRFALALLYLEIGNLNGSTIELSKIDKNKFFSKYFDFIINKK